MNSAHIAIIVLHYKNPDDTRSCLASLEKIDYPNYSVIVVSNDAPEHGLALRKEFPAIELIQNNENLGFAEGNNVGIRHALADSKTDTVLILNNDTEVEPNFLSEMARVGGDMVAPAMMQYDGRNKIDNLGVVLMSSGLPFNRRDEKQKLFCPSAGCALYSRKLLERVAYEREAEHCYFDRTYFAYCEDVDLGFRARLAGFEPTYAPDAVVYHKGSASTAKLSALAVYHTYRNLIWTQYKNLPAMLLTRQFLWLLVGWTFIFLVYLIKGRPLLIPKAVFHGLRGLGMMAWKRREAQKKRVVHVRTIHSWFERGLFPKNLLK